MIITLFKLLVKVSALKYMLLTPSSSIKLISSSLTVKSAINLLQNTVGCDNVTVEGVASHAYNTAR